MQSYVQYVKYLIFGLRTGAVIHRYRESSADSQSVGTYEMVLWPRSTERITKGKHKVKNVTLRSCTADLGTLGFNFCIILNFIDIANS